jgi:hypothetical protein
MRAVFIDPILEADFQRNGFVRLPFLSAEEVESLKQIFFDTLPISGGQITSDETGVENGQLITYDFTFIDKNPSYKREVFKVITDYFGSHMAGLLADYRPIIANYIRKNTDAGEVPLHQNWAFADERKCATVSIWCPLVDSTLENGTLQVVPKSHKRFGEVRGPMIPWELDGIKQEIISKYLVPLNTKAGDCVILDDSIVHYSALNKTDGLRLAIQLICIPKEIPSIHYFMDSRHNPKEVKVLKVKDDFYMEFNPWRKPEGAEVISSLTYAHRNITEQEFVARLNGPTYGEKTASFFDRLRNVFN